MKLNEKQRAFAEEYIKSLNLTQAAIFAGYSSKTAKQQGSRLFTNADVKSYIEKRLRDMENKRIADAEEVLEYLTSVVRGEMTEEQVIFDKEGSTIAELKAGVKDRNKAAELLGKRYALFTEKKEISGKVGVEIVDDID